MEAIHSACPCLFGSRLRDLDRIVIIRAVPHAPDSPVVEQAIPLQLSVFRMVSEKRCGRNCSDCGQVAQVVERSPEKAGVGGSTPSLATILFNNFRISLPLNLRPIASNSLHSQAA